MGPETYEIDRDGTTCQVDNQKYYRNNETGEVGGTNCDNCTEVDRVVGTDDSGNEQSMYVSKQFMKTKSSQAIGYRNNIGFKKEGTIDSYRAQSKLEGQEFLEFAYEVTDVEFNYTHSSIGGFIDHHTVSTIGDPGASAGKSILHPDAHLIYDLHTHPGGDYQPSGWNDPYRSGDMKSAGAHPSAIHQIYSGKSNGYTTYDGFRFEKDNRR